MTQRGGSIFTENAVGLGLRKLVRIVHASPLVVADLSVTIL